MYILSFQSYEKKKKNHFTNRFSDENSFHETVPPGIRSHHRGISAAGCCFLVIVQSLWTQLEVKLKPTNQKKSTTLLSSKHADDMNIYVCDMLIYLVLQVPCVKHEGLMQKFPACLNVFLCTHFSN